MSSIEEIKSITNVSFLHNDHHGLNSIKDYDQLDVDIIMNLGDNNFDYLNNDKINILFDNLCYQNSILSDIEFNKLLYDISNNNLKDIHKLVKYNLKLMFYINNI
jgi:hypothetical protein